MNGAERMRRELMIRVVRDFTAGCLEETIDRIPILLRPKNAPFSRCCLYHDRAVLKYRLMALLGCRLEDEDDEAKPLSAYLAEALAADLSIEGEPLTVASAGCSGCPESRVVVTSNCRGCFARPCLFSCPKGAITVENQQSRIDYDKCVKCGRCEKACPFNAITRTVVPCESACPVGAIRKNEHGVAEIDFSRCVFCGQCFGACPFAAIMERSQLVHILQAMKRGQKLVAIVAPSALMQFPGSVEQLFSAIHQAGFCDVMEVALGAEETTAHEAREFVEKMLAGQPLMTTSCCPAYVELVRKHVPALLDKISTTPSPMKFAARQARARHPDARVVFIGPCIAKRHEAREAAEVDAVMTFEELGALLAGRGIDLHGQQPWPLERPAAESARNYARSCGVSAAVLDELRRSIPELADFKLDVQTINGIDKKTVRTLKLHAAGKAPGNFLEVMSCPGGCVKGPCSLVK